MPPSHYARPDVFHLAQEENPPPPINEDKSSGPALLSVEENDTVMRQCAPRYLRVGPASPGHQGSD